ncbi:MAG: hypothetical protein ABIQ61_11375 [Ornithinibacter sp.]
MLSLLGLVASALVGPTAEVAQAAQRPHTEFTCQAPPSSSSARCLVRQWQDSAGRSVGPADVPGTPLESVDIRDAYNLDGTSARGRAVAIVAARGYPDLEADLAVYRAAQGLPACTAGGGCLRVVNQRGGTDPPPVLEGWPVEQALDVDAVSATCPDCQIVVVQADTADIADLGRSVVTAAGMEAVVAISNSYTTRLDQSDRKYGALFHHPGIAVTAAAGDDGPGRPGYPASSTFVTAVGGTLLLRAPATARGWTEAAWSGTGAGCSKKNSPLQGQLSLVTACRGRAVADVAAVADPSSGLAVFGPTESGSAWMVLGGTSLSSPIIASVYALAGAPGDTPNESPYLAPDNSVNDITGPPEPGCTSVLCAAGVGWDGLTGLGTPDGLGAFVARLSDTRPDGTNEPRAR